MRSENTNGAVNPEKLLFLTRGRHITRLKDFSPSRRTPVVVYYSDFYSAILPPPPRTAAELFAKYFYNRRPLSVRLRSSRPIVFRTSRTVTDVHFSCWRALGNSDTFRKKYARTRLKPVGKKLTFKKGRVKGHRGARPRNSV